MRVAAFDPLIDLFAGMEALTLHQTHVAQGEQQQATCGRSLSSNYAPPNLENKLLASTLMLKPSLQPSFLCSTSSSLLSPSSFSPSFTSPLLSTVNQLLTSHSFGLSFPLTSSTSLRNDSLLSKSLASSALPTCFASSFLPPPLGGEQSRDDGADEATEETSEVTQSSSEDSSVVHEIFFIYFTSVFH